jgi:hypothetical protein
MCLGAMHLLPPHDGVKSVINFIRNGFNNYGFVKVE